MRTITLMLCACWCVATAAAGTLATFRTSVGTLELEFFDEDKPVTVSNFIKYVQSGLFEKSFLQRWETNFVIQAGGYRVVENNNQMQIQPIPTFGQITNEYGVGRTFSNTYGTIAMARQGGRTNSATSQWFINLKDNSFLDNVDGGFTVFGRVLSGTNVLNLFIPPPPTHGIHRVSIEPTVLPTVPVLNVPPSYSDLIYLDFLLRREVGLRITMGRTGKTLSWNSVAGVSNIVEFATGFSPQWQVLTNLPGTGGAVLINDPSHDPARIYRVKLLY